VKARGRDDRNVSLSRQAMEVIEAARQENGASAAVFSQCSDLQTSLSENTVSHGLNRVGCAGRPTGRGSSSAFSTVMNDQNPANVPVIEACLAHFKDDAVAATCDRGRHHSNHRRRLMQAWADRLRDGMALAGLLFTGASMALYARREAA